jgi:hypothetical protein
MCVAELLKLNSTLDYFISDFQRRNQQLKAEAEMKREERARLLEECKEHNRQLARLNASLDAWERDQASAMQSLR